MGSTPKTFKHSLLREATIFLWLLFTGVVLLPTAIYLVGQNVFDEYGGHGFGEFFSIVSAKIRSGDAVAWFLVLSPYLAISVLRLTAWGWRYSRRI